MPMLSSALGTFSRDNRGAVSERMVVVICLAVVAAAYFALVDTELGSALSQTMGRWVGNLMDLIMRR